MIFLIATISIGPGLIVNLGLKDHWHRPRPNQTQDFNGPNPFRPWWDDSGACRKNCSFVSGEAATGFWMVAPASVLPEPWQGPAIVAAFAFGAGASLLRMAFGGHYLSDVLLGGLVTLIVIEIARLLLWRRAGVERDGIPPHSGGEDRGRDRQRRAVSRSRGSIRRRRRATRQRGLSSPNPARFVASPRLARRLPPAYKAALADEACRSVAQSGSAPRSGRGGRRFESSHSDQSFQIFTRKSEYGR